MGQFIDAPHEGPFVAYHKNAEGNGCRSKKRADGGTNGKRPAQESVENTLLHGLF